MLTPSLPGTSFENGQKSFPEACKMLTADCQQTTLVCSYNFFFPFHVLIHHSTSSTYKVHNALYKQCCVCRCIAPRAHRWPAMTPHILCQRGCMSNPKRQFRLAHSYICPDMPAPHDLSRNLISRHSKRLLPDTKLAHLSTIISK